MRREALSVAGLSLLLLVTVGAELSARLGLLGILISEVTLVLGPAWLWLMLKQVPLETLGLSRKQQRLRTLFGGALAGLGACYLMALFQQLVLERFLPTPPSVKTELHRLVAADSGWKPLFAELLALALAPAICEETLFRGGLLAAFAGKKRRYALAIGVAALGFGLFHASLYRLLPATLLGLVLGVVRVSSGSLLPAVAFHFANNAAVIAMVRLGYDEPPALGTHLGQLGLLVATVALVTGLGLSFRRSQPS